MKIENLFKSLLGIFVLFLVVSWLIPQTNAENNDKPIRSYEWIQISIENQNDRKTNLIIWNITEEPFDAAGDTIPADKKHRKYGGGSFDLYVENSFYY